VTPVTAGLEVKNGKVENGSFDEILTGLTGQIVTIINPLSYIPTLTGCKVDTETYKAKVISCENGILKILVEYVSDPRKNIREKAYQFIPIDQIKRIMVSKSERIVTL
jgi:hypothetical protein